MQLTYLEFNFLAITLASACYLQDINVISVPQGFTRHILQLFWTFRDVTLTPSRRFLKGGGGECSPEQEREVPYLPTYLMDKATITFKMLMYHSYKIGGTNCRLSQNLWKHLPPNCSSALDANQKQTALMARTQCRAEWTTVRTRTQETHSICLTTISQQTVNQRKNKGAAPPADSLCIITSNKIL
jgi:hypothetical protein